MNMAMFGGAIGSKNEGGINSSRFAKDGLILGSASHLGVSAPFVFVGCP